MIKVLLVDDHPVMRQLLRDTLESYSDLSIVGDAGSGEEAVTQATALRPSVVLMDINLPTMSGIQATKLIKLRSPSIAIIGLTAGDPGQSKAIIAAGAAALIHKGDDFDALYRSILEAVRSMNGATLVGLHTDLFGSSVSTDDAHTPTEARAA